MEVSFIMYVTDIVSFLPSLYQSPLYLIFSYLPSTPALSAAIFIFADLISAWSLAQIARRNKANSSTAIAAYLLNPYAIATCVARSTTSIDNALLLTAVARAANGWILFLKTLTLDNIDATISLALASQSTLYPIAIAYPLISLLSRPRIGVVAFFATSALLVLLGGLTGKRWLQQTLGTM